MSSIAIVHALWISTGMQCFIKEIPYSFSENISEALSTVQGVDLSV